MRKLFFSFGIVCMSFLYTSCTTTKKGLDTAYLNGEWNIVEVEGTKITGSTQQHSPYIGFDLAEKRVYGNSGCNRMMGTFTVDSLRPGTINLGTIAGTRMACADMTVEQKVLGALQRVSSFKSVNCDRPTDINCKIALCDASGNQLILMERRDTTEDVNVTDLKGEWTIKSVNGEPIVKEENNPTEPFIGFNMDENRVYGNAGCNSINGGLQKAGDENSLEFIQVATTMMMCINMDTERKVLDAVNSVKSYRMLADNKLALYDADGTELMLLEKR